MIEIERTELVAAARANLNEVNQRRDLALINGQYRDDPDAVRGAIWEYSEMEMQSIGHVALVPTAVKGKLLWQ